MSIKDKLIKNSGKAATMIVQEVVGKEAIDILVKVGSEIYEQQKLMIKIPDLKDVQIDEAQRILKDDLGLVPTTAIARPKIAYAFEHENEVVYSEPRFGTRVNPGSIVKLYYLTNSIILESKELSLKMKQEVGNPTVIGLNIIEAREDLENIGLRVAQKLENPHEAHINKTEGQVTRLTYSDGKKVGKTTKTGDRIWVYYVDEKVIDNSKKIVIQKEQRNKEVIDKFTKFTKDTTDAIASGSESSKKAIVSSVEQADKASKAMVKSIVSKVTKKPKE